MAVQQSGTITPGHAAIWATTGVIEDGGTLAAASRVIAVLKGANFNTVNDQPIPIPQRINAFAFTGILITNASRSLTTAVGGFYPQASKGGTAIVDNTQVYSSLVTTSDLLRATVSTFGLDTRFSASNLGLILGLPQVWFSLTTAQGAVASADIYLIGIDLT